MLAQAVEVVDDPVRRAVGLGRVLADALAPGNIVNSIGFSHITVASKCHEEVTRNYFTGLLDPDRHAAAPSPVVAPSLAVLDAPPSPSLPLRTRDLALDLRKFSILWIILVLYNNGSKVFVYIKFKFLLLLDQIWPQRKKMCTKKIIVNTLTFTTMFL